GKTATQCRRCRAENETLPHVFGSCPYGESMRRARHDKLKHRITALLTKQGLHCQEEMHCTDENGSTRFIDIVAIDPNSSQAFIVDPTIRYETNSDIGKEVQEEKERRSEEHTSELQSRFDLVCRLLLEKKNTSTN